MFKLADPTKKTLRDYFYLQKLSSTQTYVYIYK